LREIEGFSEESGLEFLGFFGWACEPLIPVNISLNFAGNAGKGREILTSPSIGLPLKKSGTTTRISKAVANASAPCRV
jgi:hypothetical protein